MEIKTKIYMYMYSKKNNVVKYIIVVVFQRSVIWGIGRNLIMLSQKKQSDHLKLKGRKEYSILPAKREKTKVNWYRFWKQLSQFY